MTATHPPAFSRPTRTWFDETFASPTEVQRRGWDVIHQGRHALLVAPTGSGKTLAAFLAGIDALSRIPADAPPGVRVLYVSPLKALVYDVERNLRSPLVGVRRTAERLDTPFRPIEVDIRTGDTPQRERSRQVRHPADILVTTPESLFLLLGSRARETLRSVETVIVDEIHAVAPTKRGSHLALSLERLSEITQREPQRIGLSATVRPLDEVARFLGGDRPVEIVDASAPPHVELSVAVPVPDMENPPSPAPPIAPGDPSRREMAIPHEERGIWPAIYPEIIERIRANRSTIVFTNSRGLCERLAQKLNELSGEELVQAHHGSVSHEQRATIEDALKAGRLKGIVATSSLELGIDMGAVDLVIQVESPGAVARGLQRVGRAGHQVGTASVGHIFPKFKGDLLEAAVVAREMLSGRIEALRVPQNALDVLAQQIVAMVVDQERSPDDIERIVQRAYPYHRLTRPALSSVVEMLAGAYPSEDFADLKPLLAWDRTDDRLSARRSAPMVVRMNAGTIPDRGHYAVHLGPEGPRLGELDEELVFESRAGDNILLGASTWRVEQITRDRVVVSPAPGEPGRMPFWKGEGPGRPLELGRALGAFVREASGRTRDEVVQWLQAETPLDTLAAGNLADYLEAQRDATGSLPTDRDITIERFRDELGDWRVCILSPFGARIHAPWAMAIQQLLTSRSGFDVQVMYTDDGIVLRFADVDDLPEPELLIPDPDEVEQLVTDQVAQTALFAGLFRENAARALLIPRRRAGARNPLWAQRLKAQNLMATVRRYPGFPVVLETYRQALGDVFDVPGLRELLREIGDRRLRVHEVETRSASPFARSLVFAYVANFLYEQDAPLAERRAQALTLDRGLLQELLGQAELRDLIDPDVLAELEDELQFRAEGRRARDADEVHDVLRHLGDLTPAEVAERSAADPKGWLAELEHARRATPIVVAGEERWIATEDAGLYRDALGAAPPPGLPDRFIAPVDSAATRLLRRFARHRGPFHSTEPAERYGMTRSQVEPLLQQMLADGSLLRGEIRPGGVELDWCDPDVLRRLKRRTLARLRDQVAPVAGETLALFLRDWHGVDGDRVGPERLLDVVRQLEGLALPWSSWQTVVLPSRMQGFTSDLLDMAAASGQIVWVGRGAVGARDGKVALFTRDHVRQLLTPLEGQEETLEGEVHRRIVEHLEAHGASFLSELEQRIETTVAAATSEEFRTALWDLVWGGVITNDTFAPLRTLGSAPRTPKGRGRVRAALAGGRWSLVRRMIDPTVTETERLVAQAEVLLERYGVVSREAARAEGLSGGFGGLYKVLSAMEESGRIRRGYFVEGLSGAQFGYAGAVDRLRTLKPDEAPEDTAAEDVVWLAAVDPANPYGALLPWPEPADPETRPRRMANAWVIVARGKPVLWLGSRGRRVITFPSTERTEPGALERAATLLARGLPSGRRTRLIVETVDGKPVNETPLHDVLVQAGFLRDYRGLGAP